MTVGAEPDAGSFRDTDSRVFYPTARCCGRSASAARGTAAVAASRQFAEARLVAFEVARREVLPSGTGVRYHALPR